MNAVVHRVTIPAHRRILAISDVHGNLPWLRGLLEKAAFNPRDVLVIVGDLLEKGPHSLATLRYVMDLSRTHTVYCVTGNCDVLCLDLCARGERGREDLLAYLSHHPESLICQLAEELGLPRRTPADLAALAHRLEAEFPRELAFLRSMPTVLETEDYVFVHGGVPSYQNMERLDAWSCMKNDDFMGQGYRFPKYCVVGHWPTTLYRTHAPDADPLLDRARRILSLDGGCSLNRGGQLNGVFLPRRPGGEFLTLRYDDYPVAVALDAQEESPHPVNIRWVDNAVEILERGAEFSLCRQTSTGKTLWVLTRYLGHWGGSDRCENATDGRLAVAPGDRLAVVEATSRGALVKRGGRLGWYHGGLKAPPRAGRRADMECKHGVIRAWPSLLMVLPADPAQLKDPTAIADRLWAALGRDPEITLGEWRPQRGFLRLWVRFRGSDYGLKLYPRKFGGATSLRLCHRLTAGQQAALEEAVQGLLVETTFPAVPQDGLHLQLKVATALFPEIVAVADLSSRKLYAPLWAALAAADRTPPGPDYLFGVQAQGEEEGPVWAFTQGLNRCGLIELEVPGCPPDRLALYGEILESAARVAVDQGVIPDAGVPVLLARLGRESSLVVCWLDWETGVQGLPQGWPGGRADRTQSHNRDTGLLFFYPTPQSLDQRRPVPLVHLSPESYEAPTYLLTQREGRRMVEQAQERLPWLLRGLDRPGAGALVKLTGPAGAPGWYELLRLEDGRLTAASTQEEGVRLEAQLDQIEDWLLLLEGGGLRPDHAYLLEME